MSKTLTGVEGQAEKYASGVPEHLPAKVRPLPFLYQSTGVETRFTNRLGHQGELHGRAGRGQGAARSEPGEAPQRLAMLRSGRGGDELKLASLSSLDEVHYNQWLATVRDNPQTIGLEGDPRRESSPRAPRRGLRSSSVRRKPLDHPHRPTSCCRRQRRGHNRRGGEPRLWAFWSSHDAAKRVVCDTAGTEMVRRTADHTRTPRLTKIFERTLPFRTSKRINDGYWADLSVAPNNCERCSQSAMMRR